MARLYTIEGIAAGMIMLFTTYLVLGATTVYTPGDSHISDMQLEQTGTDALMMMNTPANGTTGSQLQEIVDNLPVVNGDYCCCCKSLRSYNESLQYNVPELCE